MLKEWFILIEDNKEGPYSMMDLRHDRRVTPDTLVWKAGFKNWLPIRKVPELQKIFEDVESEKEDQKDKILQKKLPEDDTLALRAEPPYFWIIVALLAVLYLLYQLFSVGH